jgi:uncharacterized delta-60 repeat protein
MIENMKNKTIYLLQPFLFMRAFFAALLLTTIFYNIKAQPGAIDPTFNPGDIGFGNGDGADERVITSAIQSDGKIVIGGQFYYYNGSPRNRIARLNADGTLDATFNPGTGASDYVYAIAIQGDGKIIIGGWFTSYNGTSRNRIARLNADGTLDASFNSGTGANDRVYSICIQGDGKIIIGGLFTSYNGSSINRIARLNADGALDPTFNPGSGANNYIWSTTMQSDGKIIIGGVFTSYNGATMNHIARLNANGTIDATFNIGTGANDNVFKTAIKSDGKIIIGGAFTSYNGTNRNRIALLNADGTLDATFNLGTGANDWIFTTTLLSDGRIIIGGDFFYYNGARKGRIARLNADGTLDLAFNSGTGANSNVFTTAIQSNGKITIGGGFTSYNGSQRMNIARLNANGTLDNTFDPGAGTNNDIWASAIQIDGKIIIGGWFTSYNGTPINSIARLNTDGTLDNTFNIGTDPSGQIYSIALQGDGRIIIGGAYNSFNGSSRNCIARINTDGTLDNTFNPGTGANGVVYTSAIQSDGKIIIGGQFTSYNGSPRNNIARLNADGTLDATFNPGTGANWDVNTITPLSDGKIIIGGEFTSYNGSPRNRIARLNADGTLDAAFNPGTGANGPVRSIVIQCNAKIIIGGFFTSYNGSPRNCIARLNADGTLDAGFNPGTGASSLVYTTALQSDGGIIIGGNFTSYNGTGRNRIARIFGDPVGINSFQTRILSIYPNPVSEELNIETKAIAGQHTFEIFNLFGQVVCKGNFIEKTTVQTIDLLPGVYLVKVGNDKGFEIIKIVKE